MRVFDLDNDDEFCHFVTGSSRTIPISGTDRTAIYEDPHEAHRYLHKQDRRIQSHLDWRLQLRTLPRSTRILPSDPIFTFL